MTNLPATLSTLRNEISALTERMKPVVAQDVADAVQSMLTAGMSFPSSMNPAKAPEVYAFAVQNVSAAGLRKAVSKLIRGEYENLSKSFIPTPPELASLARAEMRMISEDLVRARLKLESMQPPAQSKVDEAGKARVRALVRTFRMQTTANNGTNRTIPSHEPLSREQEEYWGKIGAMSDAPSASAEQRAFRRSIESRITIPKEAAE